jgi:hypothetical protein
MAVEALAVALILSLALLAWQTRERIQAQRAANEATAKLIATLAAAHSDRVWKAVVPEAPEAKQARELQAELWTQNFSSSD